MEIHIKTTQEFSLRGFSIVKTVKHIVLMTMAMLLIASLSGCNLAVLDPQGLIAASEKNILITSVLLMLIVVVPVILLTFWISWRYRATNTAATYRPNWAHSTWMEIAMWTIPGIIILILSIITWRSSHELDPYKPLAVNNEDTLEIQVISLQWKWLFIYPEQNIATLNYAQIPIGVPVRFVISAEGPMNSFQIPQLAGQVYAMAGMQTKLHLITDKAGLYQGSATNFTGDGFSDMKFQVRASTKEEFDDWVGTVKQSSQKLTTLSYNDLIKPSELHAVEYYAEANKDIFETVVMKSMMPMNQPMHMMAQASH